VAVTLTYASGRGHALIDRALYLPEARAADEEHRELAGIPEETAFATKPQLAGQLRERAHQRGIRAAFAAYVLAVRASTTLALGSGLTMTAAGAVKLIPDRGWQRLRTGSGTEGVRHSDWAMLQITADDTPDGQDDGHSVLLIRRHRYTRTVSFYRCWTPAPVPLWRLIAVAQIRWRIEEDHQLARQVAGLDAGQVIRWRSWHRRSAICLLAYIYLAVTTAADPVPGLELIPLTIPELLRLLQGIVIPQPRRDPAHRHRWSAWRRHHQYLARQAHQRWSAYADATP